MIRLPRFTFASPTTLAEAAARLAESPADTMLLAGGTDLLPNMKRRQQTPKTVVSLRRVRDVHGVRVGDDRITVGAMTTLTELLRNADVAAGLGGLWQAAAQVATPHLRNMATLGGNLCLDTRCTYYDQTLEWRQAIGYCMKKDGDTCWVATSSPRCLAVSSTDTAPMLQALGARVRLVSASGERELAVADLFQNDGMQYLSRRPDEILADVTIPAQAGWRSTYWKLRRRGSFDFPVAAVAAVARLDAEGRVEDVRIVLGAVASKPLGVDAAGALLAGHRLGDERIAAVAEAAYALGKPMDNTDYELVWRKKMIKPLVTYALRDLRGDDTSDLRRRLARQSLIPG